MPHSESAPQNSLKGLRYVALVEATTFLALLVATYFKHADGKEQGVTVLGPIHGLLFLLYVFIALNVRRQMGWSGKTTFWVLFGAVAPFGGYIVDRWLVRTAGR